MLKNKTECNIKYLKIIKKAQFSHRSEKCKQNFTCAEKVQTKNYKLQENAEKNLSCLVIHQYHYKALKTGSLN